MTILCPYCKNRFDYRDARIDEEWRLILDYMADFGSHGRLIFEYVDKFGCNPIAMKSKKILRIMREMQGLYSSGAFRYGKKTYEIDKSGIIEALQVVNNKHFEQPLENHNYLKKVMIGISEREAKERSIKEEKALKEREQKAQGVRRKAQGEEEEWMTFEEYLRQAGGTDKT